MADAKTITIDTDFFDHLDAIEIRLSYAHSMATLMIEQRDFKNIPVHNQKAIDALDTFVLDALKELKDLQKKVETKES